MDPYFSREYASGPGLAGAQAWSLHRQVTAQPGSQMTAPCAPNAQCVEQQTTGQPSGNAEFPCSCQPAGAGQIKEMVMEQLWSTLLDVLKQQQGIGGIAQGPTDAGSYLYQHGRGAGTAERHESHQPGTAVQHQQETGPLLPPSGLLGCCQAGAVGNHHAEVGAHHQGSPQNFHQTGIPGQFLARSVDHHQAGAGWTGCHQQNVDVGNQHTSAVGYHHQAGFVNRQQMGTVGHHQVGTAEQHQRFCEEPKLDSCRIMSHSSAQQQVNSFQPPPTTSSWYDVSSGTPAVAQVQPHTDSICHCPSATPWGLSRQQSAPSTSRGDPLPLGAVPSTATGQGSSALYGCSTPETAKIDLPSGRMSPCEDHSNQEQFPWTASTNIGASPALPGPQATPDLQPVAVSHQGPLEPPSSAQGPEAEASSSSGVPRSRTLPPSNMVEVDLSALPKLGKKPPSMFRSPPRSGRRFKGVRHRKWGRYISEIRDALGRRIWLGSHDTEESAARAYDAAARVLQGEGAWFNFPLEVPGTVKLPKDLFQRLLEARDPMVVGCVGAGRAGTSQPTTPKSEDSACAQRRASNADDFIGLVPGPSQARSHDSMVDNFKRRCDGVKHGENTPSAGSCSHIRVLHPAVQPPPVDGDAMLRKEEVSKDIIHPELACKEEFATEASDSLELDSGCEAEKVTDMEAQDPECGDILWSPACLLYSEDPTLL